jgi:SulP family sulfate permease
VKFDRRELAGAVADLGVLVPIAVALIVTNGLSPTAVLVPAGLLYVVAGLVYRLPVPVQPLKAFGAIAIAEGLGANEIAAGALVMGAIFVALGASRLLDLAARAFPRPIIRGVQLVVGLLFLKIAWGLVADPPAAFSGHSLSVEVAVPLGAAALVAALLLKHLAVSLVLVAIGVVTMVGAEGASVELGPSSMAMPSLDSAAFAAALTVLVLPQLPLSFANSCLATADAARVYFGERGARVRPGRLATSFGSANLLAGALGGMPVCHGAGGMTAHVAFGARTGAAPIAMGAALLALALGVGAGLATLLAAFPLPILAALLAAAGILHIGLLRDLEGAPAWSLALLVGAIGFLVHLALAVGLGLVVWWGARAARRVRSWRTAFAR